MPKKVRGKAASPASIESLLDYQAILNNITEGIAIIRGKRLLYGSPRLFELSGYPAKALLRRSLAKFIHPEDSENAREILFNPDNLKKPSDTSSIRVIHRDGLTRWPNLRLIPIQWKGKPALLVIVTDYTLQKITEDELHRKLQELQLLREVSTVCMEASNPDDLLRQVTLIIGKSLFPSNLGIILLDETQKLLKVHSSYHLRRGAKRVSQKIGEGIVGRVVQAGKPVRTGDVRKEKNYVSADPKTLSELCVPLRTGNKILGAINAESPAQNAFSEGDERLLSTVSGLLSIALEQLKSEEILRASETRYRLLFEQSKDAIFLADAESRVIDCNHRASELFGYTREEMLNKTYRDFVVPEYHEDLRRKLTQIKKGIEPAPYEKIMITKDRRRIPVEVAPAPVFDENGKMIWFQSVIHDITEKKEAEQLQSALYRISEVGNSAKDLDQLYRALHRIIGELVNADNFYIAFYDAEADLLHFPYFIDQFDPPPQPHKPAKGLTGHVLRTGQPFLATRQQLQELRQSRDIIPKGKEPIDWLGVPLKGYGGIVFGVLVVQSYDPKIRYTEKEKNILTFMSQQVAAAITRKVNEERLRETEARFQQFEKMETIGTLVSSITHDFNNILTSIMGNAQLLDFKIAEPRPELRKYLQAIIQASESGTGLLQQLLSFTKKEELRMETLDINRVVGEWQDILMRVAGDRVTLETQLGPDIHPVLANPDRIKQILMNLVINARDAMPEGGRITIRTENVDFHEKKLHKNVPLQGQLYVKLMVRDTGLGMDLPTVSKIFDPFFTTKPNGTGLGLTIVKRIVEQMDGFITLQSLPGRGTSFIIYIPRFDEANESIAPIQDERIIYGNGEKILLVEDEPEVREMLVTLLRDYMKYSVIEAADGKEALQALKGTCIDLVITDIRMGEMNGIALVSKIQEMYPYLRDKVIGITACTEYSETYLKEIGFAELIYKPIKSGFLSRTIKKYI